MPKFKIKPLLKAQRDSSVLVRLPISVHTRLKEQAYKKRKSMNLLLLEIILKELQSDG